MSAWRSSRVLSLLQSWGKWCILLSLGEKEGGLDFGGGLHLATTSLCCYCSLVETPSHVFYEAKVDIDKARGIRDGTQSPKEWPAPPGDPSGAGMSPSPCSLPRAEHPGTRRLGWCPSVSE